MRGLSNFAALAATGASLLCGGGAFGQERPSESEMFGAEPASPTPPEPAAPAEGAAPEPQDPARAPSPPASRDAEILGGSRPDMFSEEAAPDDPLEIGGQLYLRAQGTALEGQPVGDFSFSAPSLLDLYLDARPNDRVRGFVLGRMSFDSTLPSRAGQAQSIGAPGETGDTAGSPDPSSLLSAQTRGPHVSLDQLWLRFDVAHTVFVTAGKQHVRWGTGRFWAPTDYLHFRRRNPLDVFDARSGTTMLKLHLPVESKAWNFYAFGVTEADDATPQLNRIAGAARAELVFGPTELGIGAFVRRHQKPKLAADLSAGIGDFDFYGELAVQNGGDVDRVQYAPNAVVPDFAEPASWETPQQTALRELGQVVDAFYPVYRSKGWKAQAVGGLSYARKYNDNDVFTLGVEYFYNGLGHQSPAPYPGLVLPHSTELRDPATFFYLGQQYGAVFFSMPSPYSLDNHTFTLSTLGNLSDLSFITRFDYSYVLLTHIRFEAFISARYGHENGEFRFGVTDLELGGQSFSRPPSISDFGVALRVDI
jgi:hypothetical protein